LVCLVLGVIGVDWPLRKKPPSHGNRLSNNRLAANPVVAYKQQMPTVRMTETFATWLHELRDAKARSKVAVRIQRLEDGNPGDVVPVGDGVSEMRIHYGPGYRVYYVNRGSEFVILLCGGDKGSQSRDIEAAKHLAQEEK
jgi:putative addiction module killer protein